MAAPQLAGRTGGRLLEISKQVFGADLRSLALMRMGAATVILLDLAMRAGDLVAHYTDAGVLPRDAHVFSGPWFPSYVLHFHLLGGSAAFEAGMFAFAAGLAVALLLGWRTRAATVLSWLLLLSLHVRNPMIRNGGDDLLRAVLFWGMFLPWGERWSLDIRRRSPESSDPNDRVVGVATAGYLVQILILYWMAGLQKTAIEWRESFTAVYYALNLETLLLPPGALLAGFPALVKPLTAGTLALEIFGPFLLLLPLFFGPVRTATLLALAAMHAGFGLSLWLGLFPLVNFLALAGLLPTWFWDRIDKLRGRVPPARVEVRRVGSLVTSVVAGVALVAAVGLAAGQLTRTKVPAQIKQLQLLIRFHQGWSVFAPGVPKVDGWYVAAGRMRDGREVDLLAGGAPVSFEKPEAPRDRFESFRWMLYLGALRDGHLRLEGDTDPRSYRLVLNGLTDYLCRRWNRERPPEEAVESIELTVVTRLTPPPVFDAQPLQTESAGWFSCP